MAVVLSLTSLAPADAFLPPPPRTPESIRVENKCTIRGLLAKGYTSLMVIHCCSVYKSISRVFAAQGLTGLLTDKDIGLVTLLVRTQKYIIIFFTLSVLSCFMF